MKVYQEGNSPIDQENDYYDTIPVANSYNFKGVIDDYPTKNLSGSTTASIYNGSISYAGSLIKVTKTTATSCVD